MTARTLMFTLTVVATLFVMTASGSGAAAPTPIIAVNSYADSVVAGDSACTLREAINNANADTDTTAGDCAPGRGDDLIELSAGTYALTIAGRDENANRSGDLDLRGNLILRGAGAAETVLDGNQLDRVLHVASAGALVELQDLTVTGGRVIGVPLTAPAAYAYGGAGLFNDHGTLTLHGVIVRDNAIDTRAGGRGSGGGILTHGGHTRLSEVTVSGNRASWGGGIAVSHKLGTWIDTLITSSTISVNTAEQGGGGLWIDGKAPNQNVISITGSSVTGNEVLATSAAGGGGGLYVGGSILTLVSSTVADNVAAGAGAPSSALGGGVTFKNSSGVMANTTVSGNRAPGAGPSLSGLGGGLAVVSTEVVTTLSLINVTVTNNEAHRRGGGLSVINDTGPRAEVSFRNTIVAGNAVTAGPDDNCSTWSAPAWLVSQGNNLENLDSCQFDAPSDLIHTRPRLGPLQDNGGPTWTHELLRRSPARDAAHDVTCDAHPINGVDQRGMTRPQGAHCDIGAFEAETVVSTVVQAR